jgi:hypothetical protein
MHIHFVIIDPATKWRSEPPRDNHTAPGEFLTARVIESRTGILPIAVAEGNVIFAVRSKDEAQCRAISTAILDLNNIWIAGALNHREAGGHTVRPRGNWQPNDDASPASKAEYVYVYAKPSTAHLLDISNIFYIGRGINNRWLSHVRDSEDYRLNTNETDPLDTLKFQTIEQTLELAGVAESSSSARRDWARKNLVRRIAHFTGEFSREQSEAVENFLINYWIGVFYLANKTRGNSHLNDAEWISYPRLIRQKEPWDNIVRIFSGAGSVTQGPLNLLLREELNSMFTAGPGNWSPSPILDDGGTSSTRLVPVDQRFSTNKTDVFANYHIVRRDVPLLKLHLKMGKKDTGAVINIRPLDGDHKNFEKKIADTFFNGAAVVAKPFIKAPGPDAYFKPCADPSGKKQVDVPFDLRQPIHANLISEGAPILRGSRSRRMTLGEALQEILTIAHESQAA